MLYIIGSLANEITTLLKAPNRTRVCDFSKSSYLKPGWWRLELGFLVSCVMTGFNLKSSL